MNGKIAFLVMVGVTSGCGGTSNILKQYDKKPQDIDKAAILLEENNPQGAKSVLLQQIPQAAQLVLGDDSLKADDLAYAQSLAASMQNVPSGDRILSMYATAEAGSQEVGALNIMVDIMQIDDQQKASATSLKLDQAGDNQAIATFYPAMPAKCSTNSAAVLQGLDHAIDILYATAILRGFDTSNLSAHKIELIASLTPADMFNNAIFCQVNFICRVMNLDTNGDKSISAGEASAIGSIAEATRIYGRIQSAIDAVAAMTAVNPKNTNLAKALKRMQDYKAKIDNSPGNSLLEKLIGFLVSQSH